MNVGIIGLGLIGGSMGLALKESDRFTQVLGYDISALHTQQALSLGLVDECVSIEEIQKCDVIFIATPLCAIIDTLKIFEQNDTITWNQLIIDVGGAKSEIIQAISPKIRKNFVAAHPMSGTEKSGPKAAIKDLFKDKIVVLTDIEESGEFQVALAKEIFISIGMKIVKMDSIKHDRQVAFISHMPHIASFALSNVVLDQEEPESIVALAGGGFKSMSRISKSDPIMWSDVFMQNKANTLLATKLLKDELDKAIKMLESDDFDALKAWMSNANKLHDII